MLPACRTESEGFSIPTFAVEARDVEGFVEALWEFQSAFHDSFARSEPRYHFFDYMVGQLSALERKSVEPMALQVEGGTIRGMQRFLSDVLWDEEQMLWNYHQPPCTVAALAVRLPAASWYRRTVSEGTKGPITYEFARQRVTLCKDGLPERTVWLVLKRTVGAEPSYAYPYNDTLVG